MPHFIQRKTEVRRSQLMEGRAGIRTQSSSLTFSKPFMICLIFSGDTGLPYSRWHCMHSEVHPVPKGAGTPPIPQSASSVSSAHHEPRNPGQPLWGGQTSGSQLAQVWLMQVYDRECRLCVCLFFFSLLIIKLDNEPDE